MKKIAKMSTTICLILILSLVFTLTGCGQDSAKEEGPTISVACKPWTEQLILGNMLIQLLEANGYPVEDRTGLGETSVIRPALHAGEVDVYWEYTGTTLISQMGHDVVTDPKEVYDIVKKWDKEENDVVWLDYALANNTYTLMMRKEDSENLEIKSISDLAKHINENPEAIRMATNIEFLDRPDGIPGLQEEYGFEFNSDKINTMAIGLTYEALKSNKTDVAMGFGTDGRIVAFNFKTLEDDKKFFPVYNPAPVIRQEILDAYPEVADVINKLPSLLDGETLSTLNKKVDVDQEEPEDVAKEFLKENGLIE